jgi:hypothetical protein
MMKRKIKGHFQSCLFLWGKRDLITFSPKEKGTKLPLKVISHVYDKKV